MTQHNIAVRISVLHCPMINDAINGQKLKAAIIAVDHMACSCYISTKHTLRRAFKNYVQNHDMTTKIRCTWYGDRSEHFTLVATVLTDTILLILILQKICRNRIKRDQARKHCDALRARRSAFLTADYGAQSSTGYPKWDFTVHLWESIYRFGPLRMCAGPNLSTH